MPGCLPRGRASQADARREILRQNEMLAQGARVLAGEPERMHAKGRTAQGSLVVDANGRADPGNPNEAGVMKGARERAARTGATAARMRARGRSADVEALAIVARRMKGAGTALTSGHQVGALVGRVRTTIAMVMTTSRTGCTWMKDALTSSEKIGA